MCQSVFSVVVCDIYDGWRVLQWSSVETFASVACLVDVEKLLCGCRLILSTIVVIAGKLPTSYWRLPCLVVGGIPPIFQFSLSNQMNLSHN